MPRHARGGPIVRCDRFGLASHYVARRRDPAVIAQLQTHVDALSAAAERPGITPLAFARLGGNTAAVIVRPCGASYLAQILSDRPAVPAA